MSTGAAFRGQPLLLFGVIIAAWGGARMVTWEPLPPPHYVEDSVALASLQSEAEHPATLMPWRQDLAGIGWWGDRFGPYAAELPPALPVARLRRRLARLWTEWIITAAILPGRLTIRPRQACRADRGRLRDTICRERLREPVFLFPQRALRARVSKTKRRGSRRLVALVWP